MSKCLNCSIGNHNHCTNPSQTSVVKLCCCGYTASGAVGLQKTGVSSGEPPTLRKLAPVSPNTNIDEKYYKKVSGEPYGLHNGGLSNIYYKDCTYEVEALLSAARIDELKHVLDTGEGVSLNFDPEINPITRDERIKELKEKQ